MSTTIPDMGRQRVRRLLTAAALAACAWGLVGRRLWHHPAAATLLPALPRVSGPRTEAEGREQFHRQHPGELPYHVRIARAAELYHHTRPMGEFVLSLTNAWGNDCSDYVACCVDHGLGVGARFERHSDAHLLGERPGLFDAFWWQPGLKLAPGDEVSVRHSPYYPPNDKAGWHVGLVGTDDHVYDFSKLKVWKEARYGRQSFAAFTRHSHGEHEILIWRLRWQYRYGVWPLPRP